MKRFILVSLLSGFSIYKSVGQQIIDPCFVTVHELGFFYGSEVVKNICNCIDYRLATDMMEWDGNSWQGVVAYNVLNLAPPPGCNKRAMWMGEAGWTPGGEGFSLKLDKPLEAGKTYSYTFTYASDGNGSNGAFSPKIYTSNTYELTDAVYTGRMPNAPRNWVTNTYSFTAQFNQDGHEWLILYAYESSGLVMGECDVQKLYPDEANLLGEDKLICSGRSITLAAPKNPNYKYQWNTGSNTSSILVDKPGHYDVTIQYGNCSAFSSISVATEDCEVRLEMPNVFTPNQDSYNSKFIPKEHNYLEGGVTRIYNRWGDLIFKGELFTGWDGQLSNGKEAANGVYFYSVFYTDKDKNNYTAKGHLTVIR